MSRYLIARMVHQPKLAKMCGLRRLTHLEPVIAIDDYRIGLEGLDGGLDDEGRSVQVALSLLLQANPKYKSESTALPVLTRPYI